VHDSHKKIIDKIVQNNANYKLRPDVRKELKTFNVSDYVMVRIRPEQFPPATVKKQYVRSAGPFQILMKLTTVLILLIFLKILVSILHSILKI